MKSNIGKKVEGLSKAVEKCYVNERINTFYFLGRNASVEKPVDNVENSGLSTGICPFSPGDSKKFPHFLTKNDSFPVAGYACYGNGNFWNPIRHFW